MRFGREIRHRRRQTPSSAATVSIYARDLAQMLNSLDPSPFWDRDLDRDAAQFIEDEFSEKMSAGIWHLHVHAREGTASAVDLQAAVQRYYDRLASSQQRALREHFRRAQLALAGGVLIFLICMGVRSLAYNAFGAMPLSLDEGLIILAWIALWRPAEALLYEWIPLYRKRRLFERLAGVRVSVLPYVQAPEKSSLV